MNSTEEIKQKKTEEIKQKKTEEIIIDFNKTKGIEVLEEGEGENKEELTIFYREKEKSINEKVIDVLNSTNFKEIAQNSSNGGKKYYVFSPKVSNKIISMMKEEGIKDLKAKEKIEEEQIKIQINNFKEQLPGLISIENKIAVIMRNELIYIIDTGVRGEKRNKGYYKEDLEHINKEYLFKEIDGEEIIKSISTNIKENPNNQINKNPLKEINLNEFVIKLIIEKLNIKYQVNADLLKGFALKILRENNDQINKILIGQYFGKVGPKLEYENIINNLKKNITQKYFNFNGNNERKLIGENMKNINVIIAKELEKEIYNELKNKTGTILKDKQLNLFKNIYIMHKNINIKELKKELFEFIIDSLINVLKQLKQNITSNVLGIFSYLLNELKINNIPNITQKLKDNINQLENNKKEILQYKDAIQKIEREIGDGFSIFYIESNEYNIGITLSAEEKKNEIKDIINNNNIFKKNIFIDINNSKNDGNKINDLNIINQINKLKDNKKIIDNAIEKAYSWQIQKLINKKNILTNLIENLEIIKENNNFEKKFNIENDKYKENIKDLAKNNNKLKNSKENILLYSKKIELIKTELIKHLIKK